METVKLSLCCNELVCAKATADVVNMRAAAMPAVTFETVPLDPLYMSELVPLARCELADRHANSVPHAHSCPRTDQVLSWAKLDLSNKDEL